MDAFMGFGTTMQAARPTFSLSLRIAAVFGLTLVAYFGVFYELAMSIIGGSRTAYLMVIPVLLVMIAYGASTGQNGVGDDETDWILAVVLGGLALFTSYLTTNRFPTLSGLWNLQLVGAVVWTASAAIILFGVRPVWQLWPMWLLALVTVTPLPSLLVTAALGGTTTAVSAVAALIGAAAVFLGAQRSPLHWRLVAAAGCAVVGVGAAAVLAARPLAVSAGLAACVIPLLSFLLLARLTAARIPDRSPTTLPHRSAFSLIVLASIACVQLALNTLAATTDATLAHADANWTTKAGLTADQEFGFIHRYLGSEATFTRYLAAPVQGYSATAVDVITANNLAALRNYRDVVWYPAPALPNYRTISIGTVITDALVLATDAAAAASGAVQNWYALTWLWRAGAKYQQVFVIVNQTWTRQDNPPPRPVPPSWRMTVLAPTIWITRQQADPLTVVDPLVSDRAQRVVNDLVEAASARHG